MIDLRPFFTSDIYKTARFARLIGSFFVASMLFALLLWSVAPTEAEVDEISGAMMDGRREGLFLGEPIVPLNASWLSSDNDFSWSVAWGDVDGDGDLDLAVANYLGPNKLYLNEGGTLTQQANWSSNDNDQTRSVAWGDIDGDGDLDLAVGNEGAPNKLYSNEGGMLIAKASWSSDDNDMTLSVAWADVDGDSDLDLAVGNVEAANKLYLNEGGTLTKSASWSSDDEFTSLSVAWADVDDDGDLDLAVGNDGDANKIYLNNEGSLTTSASWSSNDSDNTTSVAWADVDGDGDLDLAVGNSEAPNKLYLNEGGTLTTNAVWSSNESNFTSTVAWADVDNDGDLDLAVGNYFEDANQLYLNEGGMLTANASWSSNDGNYTSSVAWADVDGDSDLDLVVSNLLTPNKLYRNEGATLKADWSLNESDLTLALAWGDVDRDGDLDLAVSNNGQPNNLYLNEGGRLTHEWSSSEEHATTSLAWGDVEGDGDLDLAVGNVAGVNQLYLNEDGRLTTSASWLSEERDDTHSVAWGDVDGDGDLDLAVANYEAANKLYRNDGGTLETRASWSSNDRHNSRSVAWGDLDGDGDLDLAVSNIDGPNNIYLNEEGTLTERASWSSDEIDDSSVVAWADVDSDGDLDLAVSNWGPNQLYLNESGTLATRASWSSNDSEFSYSMAWADVDGDGDLDLAVGNWDAPNQLYRNEQGILTANGSELSNDDNKTFAIAWADIDHDGDLDLAAGNYQAANQLYLNQRPAHPLYGQKHNPSLCQVGCPSVALALSQQIAPANFHALPDIHDSHMIPISYTLFHPTAEPIGEVRAFYSLDGGGAWHPAVASHETMTSNLSSSFAVYNDQLQSIGQNGSLTSSLSFSSLYDVAQVGELEVELTISHTHSSQLAAALHTPWPAPTGTTVLLFDGVGGDSAGVANLTLSEEANESIMSANGELETTITTLLGDSFVSHDVPQIISELGPVIVTSTLVITDGPTKIEDVNVVDLTGHHSWISDLEFTLRSPAGTELPLLTTFCFGAYDFTVSLDDESEAGAWPCPVPADGTYQPFSPLSLFDGEDSNGTWTLIISNTRSAFGGQLENWGLRFDDETISTRRLPIEGRYRPVDSLASLRGMPANTPFTLMITDSASIGRLDSWQLRSVSEHIYHWDVAQSGLFGQSDNVLFRLEALPNQRPISNSIPGPFQRPFVSAQTYPFRVRGTQVQVLSGTRPVKDALVYRLPAGQLTNATSIANHANQPFHTDQHGYLQGRGELAVGDKLVALWPIRETESYTLYHTSAIPTETGLEWYTVKQGGIQTLHVSPDHPLILFDLDLSLQWDARQDGTFLADLEEAIQHASAILYDVSNGQVALGEVRIHQAKEHWLSSHIVMHASNNIRPRASMGGIVLTATDEIALSGVITDAYTPGQIRMGPIWDPFGETHFDLGQEWWRALAHELSHYLFFLPDNYLGISDDGQLIEIDCQGSFMSHTHDDAYSEFLTSSQWVGDCLQSIAARTTGRTDWETISTFYPMLNHRGGNPGPSTLPLHLTQVTHIEPDGQATSLSTRNFDLRDANNGALLPIPQAVGYLFKTQGNRELTDDKVIALGSTGFNGDRIKVRGAEVGDRVCVLSSSEEERMLGCEEITPHRVSISMQEVPDWSPSIGITPVNSRTYAITVTQAITSSLSWSKLNVQVLPDYGHPLTPTLISSSWKEMIALDASHPSYTEGGLTFSQVISLPYPAFSGFVRVWVPNNSTSSELPREAISQFLLTSAWGPSDRGWEPSDRGWEPSDRGWEPSDRGWEAPVMSGDGQLTVFNVSDPFGESYVSSLQAVSTLPQLPSWLTLVGQAYHVTLQDAPDPITRTIAFDYLQRDVPDGYEQTLKISYLPDHSDRWQRLETKLYQDSNLAVAQMPANGTGTYALISTIKMPPFQAGWNQFGYPVAEERAVNEALASIEGYYTSVYYYNPTIEGWQLYDDTVVNTHPEYATLVNDLSHLSFAHSYWLYATEAVTLSLGVPDDNPSPNRKQVFDPPPTTFYGPIPATEGFNPTEGMPITATINGTLCGESTIVELNGQLVYKMQIEANRGHECEEYDQSITFTVGEQLFNYEQAWDNSQAWYYRLGDESSTTTLQLTEITVQANALPWRKLMIVMLSFGLLCFVGSRWHRA